MHITVRTFLTLSLLSVLLLPSVSCADPWTVVLNELMAGNQTAVSDAHGDHDDWIELHNYGDHALDVAGCYLSDDPADPAKWRIPTANPSLTTIPARGHLVAWADNEAGEGPLHAGFKLDADGETLTLYDPQGVVLDMVTFDAQTSDTSYARLPDGSGLWLPCPTPTPGRANGTETDSIAISEIMYHPYHAPRGSEDTRQEWIELLNHGARSVNLAGWRLADGVDYTFAEVVLEPGAHLVVVADAQVFLTRHPGVTNVVGGWTGRLGNSGERLTLVDPAGVAVDSVRYADEGDWSARELGLLDHEQRGWQWTNEHDGGGRSLELINAALPNDLGQNWAAAAVEGGTPGRVNSPAHEDIAPMILEVRHSPIIPGPADPVTVTARVLDERTTGVSVTLRYRLDASAYADQYQYPRHDPASYHDVPMLDDGAHGDGRASDGVFGARIPAQSDGAVVEFYVEARDQAGNVRTWPAPSTIDGDSQQVTNALYQVNGSFDPRAPWIPGSQPIFFLIMTEVERARLEDIGNGRGGPGAEDDSDSNARMNGTFISVDGTGVEVRYRVGIRNRGKGSRDTSSGRYRNNYRVDFPSDRRWHGLSAINIKNRYGHVAVLGSAVWRMANLPAERITPIQVRVNGQDLALSDSTMLGSYALVEVIDDEFAARQFPGDPDGNAYRCGNDVADLGYDGPDPSRYYAGYEKQTNAAANDYNDLIELTYVLNRTPPETLVEEARMVLHLEQWVRYLAVDALCGNREGGLTTPRGDDYAMYRGVLDPRFWLIPHDLDTLFGQGGTVSDINRSVNVYAGLDGLHELLTIPDVQALYYAQLVELIDTVFSPQQFDPLVDHVLGGWVPEEIRTQIKEFVVRRNAAVLAQIPVNLTMQSTAGGMPSTAPSGESDPTNVIARPDAQRRSAPGATKQSQSQDARLLRFARNDMPQVSSMASRLVINEVLAINRSAVERGGTFPDLIELYYDGPTAISLSGMTLSDDSQQPAKFVFPASTTMHPGTYLVLSADDDLGFGLDAAGDAVYLYDHSGALIDSVEFGAQLPDLSLGRVEPDGLWHLTSPTFGRANVLHPVGDAHGVRINEWLASGKVLFESDFIELHNPLALPVDLGGSSLTDTPATEPGRHRFRPLTFVAAEGYIACDADGRTEPGHVNFRLSPDGDMIALFDGASNEVDKVIFAWQTTDAAQGRCPDGAERLEFLPLPTPGLSNGVLPETSVTTFDLIPEAAAKRALVPLSVDHVADDWKTRVDFDDSDWLSAAGPPGGVGFERSSGYEHLISLDVEASMYGQNGTCYIRIPFDVPTDSATLSELRLYVRYDDGFVAYLNGTEVARANASGTLRWNSRADASHEAAGSTFDEVLDLSDWLDLLRPGDNLLAVQAMNNSTTSSDFIFSTALEARTIETEGGEYPYVAQLFLLEGLRVTELMYHAPQGEEHDYIELQNVASVPLDLTGVRFTAGVDFRFPSMILAPGAYVVVASDPAAFRAHYGADIPVAGPYTGRLGNSGEEIVLKLPPPFDAAILRFRYADAWYPTTDGGSQSLAIEDPAAPAATWNDPESWRASDPTPGRP